MQRVLITVVGTRKRVNLAVPSEPPIAELLSTLVDKCGESADRTSWSVAHSSSGTLPLDRSLHDCGVTDGAILYLAAGTSAGGDPMRVNRFHSLSDLTRALLPHRPSVWTRLDTVLHETFPSSPRVVRPQPQTEQPLAPAALSTWQPDGAAQRAFRAWRATAYQSLLEERIIEPRLRRCVTVAVMSPKGGVGKTTISALVGTLLAQLRRDRVVAIDTNPDFGSLGRSLTANHRTYVDDLIHLLNIPSLSVTSLDAHLGRAANGLMVVPAPTDPARMASLDEEAYLHVIRRLQALVGVIVLDCGTGLQEPPARAALKAADQIVLVTDADPATASIVVEGSRLLAQTESRLVLAVNKMPSGRVPLDVDLLGQHVRRARGLVIVPNHRRAAARLSMGTFRWQEAPRAWRIAISELVAILAADWSELGTA
jgi:MinD-like ATPase involved in chromosome partitioning or flagellar assembly